MALGRTRWSSQSRALMQRRTLSSFKSPPSPIRALCNRQEQQQQQSTTKKREKANGHQEPKRPPAPALPRSEGELRRLPERIHGLVSSFSSPLPSPPLPPLSLLSSAPPLLSPSTNGVNAPGPQTSPRASAAPRGPRADARGQAAAGARARPSPPRRTHPLVILGAEAVERDLTGHVGDAGDKRVVLPQGRQAHLLPRSARRLHLGSGQPRPRNGDSRAGAPAHPAPPPAGAPGPRLQFRPPARASAPRLRALPGGFSSTQDPSVPSRGLLLN